MVGLPDTAHNSTGGCYQSRAEWLGLSTNRFSQDRLIEATGLRAMLEGCRHEIDTVRHYAAFGDDGRVGGVATGLDLRLENIAERLERATRALDRFVGSGAAAASSPDSAYMFVREADHRIKNSLQAVISLLDRQANRTKVEAARDALPVATARVSSAVAVSGGRLRNAAKLCSNRT